MRTEEQLVRGRETWRVARRLAEPGFLTLVAWCYSSSYWNWTFDRLTSRLVDWENEEMESDGVMPLSADLSWWRMSVVVCHLRLYQHNV
jgi:hypothetical protein